MLVIGEKLNTSRAEVEKAAKARDTLTIQSIAKTQEAAGAHYIDINCGTFLEEEPETLAWMTQVVQEAIKKPLCIDSPNPEAIKAALKINKGRKPIINSITAQKNRYKDILPLVTGFGASVIALCMDDEGIPETIDGRVSVAIKLVNNLTRDGVPIEDILIDPMIQPLATCQSAGFMALKTLASIKCEIPGVRTVCGLSNISFGLPQRQSINNAFLVLAIKAGLDAAIMDPLSPGIMTIMHAAELISGEDEYCGKYIQAIRDLNQ
ncbi:MAG: dihydropteroate synthase [Clostridiales bacterium]|nr:dihydropteroate synthase [Clostridiales bacterium]